MRTPLMRGGHGTVGLRRTPDLMAFGRASVSLVLHNPPIYQSSVWPSPASLPRRWILLELADRRTSCLQGLPHRSCRRKVCLARGSACHLRCPGTSQHHLCHDSTIASTQGVRPCDPPAGHTALDYPKLFGYTVPMDKSVAAAMGSVIALLCVAVVGLAVGWRLAVTRSRKAYKKWGEEVCCRPPVEGCAPLEKLVPTVKDFTELACCRGDGEIDTPIVCTKDAAHPRECGAV